MGILSSRIIDFSLRRVQRSVVAILCASALCHGAAFAQNRNLSVDQAAPPASDKRYALVIGNSAYKTSPLRNPANDARAMAKALRESGFNVVERIDVSRREMGRVLREFGDLIARDKGTGLFYFAGHGMQIKGRNFLIPVDADIEREDEVAYAAIDAGEILDKMESAKNAMNIVILDACRNNPFARSFRSSSQGLAQMDAPKGSLVAYATSPGSTANDGDGANGMYTAALLEFLAMPGLRLEDVFKKVRVAVMNRSKGQQIPWESSSLVADFYFREQGAAAAVQGPALNAPPAQAGAPAGGQDMAVWGMIKDSTQRGDFEEFIKLFPKSPMTAFARRRLNDIASADAVNHRLAAEVELRKKAEQEARQRAEAEARTRVQLDQLAKERAEAEARARVQADEQQRQRLEADARQARQAEEQARRRVELAMAEKNRAEMEARQAVEEVARLKTQQDAARANLAASQPSAPPGGATMGASAATSAAAGRIGVGATLAYRLTDGFTNQVIAESRFKVDSLDNALYTLNDGLRVENARGFPVAGTKIGFIENVLLDDKLIPAAAPAGGSWAYELSRPSTGNRLINVKGEVKDFGLADTDLEGKPRKLRKYVLKGSYNVRGPSPLGVVISMTAPLEAVIWVNPESGRIVKSSVVAVFASGSNGLQGITVNEVLVASVR